MKIKLKNGKYYVQRTGFLFSTDIRFNCDYGCNCYARFDKHHHAKEFIRLVENGKDYYSSYHEASVMDIKQKERK